MDNISNLIDRDPKGTYCILFQNRYELEIDEIKNLFSQFGKIENINCAGDKRGYRFIRYNTYDEAERALIGLKDHPKITFAPSRKKAQENQSSDRRSFSHKNKSGGSGFKQRRISNGENDAEKALNKNTRDETPWGDKSPHFKGSETKSSKKNSEQTPWSNKSPLLEDPEIKLSKNYNEETPWGDKLPLLKGSERKPNKTNTNVPRNTKLLPTKDSENRILPSNSDQTNAGKTSEEEIPDLISTATSAPKNKYKKKILEAQEIIVGNIHVEYGAAFILHLMEKFEPIAISKIFSTPKHEKRYCHVYFKTVQDAIEVENKFDKLRLSGQELVVLRPARLIKEANV